MRASYKLTFVYFLLVLSCSLTLETYKCIFGLLWLQFGAPTADDPVLSHRDRGAVMDGMDADDWNAVN